MEDDWICINVRGIIFKEKRNILCSDKSPMLTKMFSLSSSMQPSKVDNENHFLIEKVDPITFCILLQVLKTNKLPAFEDINFVKKLITGAEYFCLSEITTSLKELLHRISEQEMKIQSQIRDLKNEIENKQSEVNRLYSYIKISGNAVNYRTAKVGDRVRTNKGQAYTEKNCPGKIISVTEEYGTEIGVRWDDGTEHHNLWCGKNNGWSLIYD